MIFLNKSARPTGLYHAGREEGGEETSNGREEVFKEDNLTL